MNALLGVAILLVMCFVGLLIYVVINLRRKYRLSCYTGGEYDIKIHPSSTALVHKKLHNTSNIKRRKLRKSTGLGKDFDVYMHLIKDAEFEPRPLFGSFLIKQGDLALAIEHIPLARLPKNTIFVPNQELVSSMDENILMTRGHVSTVLCKSNYARDVFTQMKQLYHCTWDIKTIVFPPVLTTNFFSFPKDRNIFFHPAGHSWMKSTSMVINTWIDHPEWPNLVITCAQPHCYSNHKQSLHSAKTANNIHIYEYMTKAEVDKFKKFSGYVILPSACEGFGHSVYEAWENGNMLLSSDIPPINEQFIHGKNCLLTKPSGQTALGDTTGGIKYVQNLSRKTGISGSSCFTFSQNGIEELVQQAQALTDVQYNKIRQNALDTLYNMINMGETSMHKTFLELGFQVN